jgi:hypothetical protein
LRKRARINKSDPQQDFHFKDKRRKTMSTPSTTIITNLKGVTPPTANTIADSNAAGLDVSGMLALALMKAYELKVCLNLLVGHTDSADPNLATLDNVLASLV